MFIDYERFLLSGEVGPLSLKQIGKVLGATTLAMVGKWLGCQILGRLLPHTTKKAMILLASLHASWTKLRWQMACCTL